MRSLQNFNANLVLPVNWTKFDTAAKRIRCLRNNEEHEALSPPLLTLLVTLRVGHPIPNLLPNLNHFHWQFKGPTFDQSDCATLLAFLFPKIETLTKIELVAGLSNGDARGFLGAFRVVLPPRLRELVLQTHTGTAHPSTAPSLADLSSCRHLERLTLPDWKLQGPGGLSSGIVFSKLTTLHVGHRRDRAEETYYFLTCLVASCAELRHLGLIIAATSLDEEHVSSFDELAPLLELGKLETTAIYLFKPLVLSERDVQRMGQAWPSLRIFVLTSFGRIEGQPTTPIQRLRDFAEAFSDTLEALIHAFSAESWIPDPTPTQRPFRRLFKLFLENTPLPPAVDVYRLGSFIGSLCPKTKAIYHSDELITSAPMCHESYRLSEDKEGAKGILYKTIVAVQNAVASYMRD